MIKEIALSKISSKRLNEILKSKELYIRTIIHFLWSFIPYPPVFQFQFFCEVFCHFLETYK